MQELKSPAREAQLPDSRRAALRQKRETFCRRPAGKLGATLEQCGAPTHSSANTARISGGRRVESSASEVAQLHLRDQFDVTESPASCRKRGPS